MNRRTFIQSFSGLAVSTLWGTALNACARVDSQSGNAAHTHASNSKEIMHGTQDADVIIIGAGIAGLAAARALKEQGLDVRVIEARGRIGGRIHTSRAWADLPMDLGASWIHGVRNNPISQIADAAGAQRVKTEYDNAHLYIAPELQKWGVQDTAEDSMRSLVHEALKKAQRLDADISLQAAVEQALSNKRISQAGMAQLNFYLSSVYEQEYAGDANQMSAQTIDDNEVLPGADVLFPSGYSQITDYLAQGLRVDLNQMVQRIDYGDAQVSIHTSEMIYRAKQVLITLPLGVLKAQKIKFTPALPEFKRTAIERLGVGLLNKHFFRFDRVFWDAHFDWHEYLSNEKGAWSEWVSFAKVGNTPVLLGFSAASRAHLVEQLSDAEIQAEAMSALRHMFGNDIPDPIEHQFTRWAQDPYALGSYSFNAVGSTNAHRADLARPINQQVFWAGEACNSLYPGTVHGAYLSGVQAAKSLLKAVS